MTVNIGTWEALLGAAVLAVMTGPCVRFHAARYVERTRQPGWSTWLLRTLVAAGSWVFPVAVFVLVFISGSQWLFDSTTWGWALLLALTGAGGLTFALWRTGRRAVPPPEPSSDEQTCEVQRMQTFGFKPEFQRADGSITMSRRSSQSWKPDETIHISAEGDNDRTFGPYLSFVVFGPLFVAMAYDWRTLVVTIPVAVGYVWFMWTQFQQEAPIPTQPDMERISEADKHLRQP